MPVRRAEAGFLEQTREMPLRSSARQTAISLQLKLMRFGIHSSVEGNSVRISKYGAPFWIDVDPNNQELILSSYVVGARATPDHLRKASFNEWGIAYGVVDNVVGAELRLPYGTEERFKGIVELASEFGWQCEKDFKVLRSRS